MNPEPNQSNELGKLVDALRHKAPPPPHDVVRGVIAEIKSPSPAGPLTWWQRLGLDFDKQPVLVCASGVAVCGLLIYGLITSLRVSPPAGPALLLDSGLASPGVSPLTANGGMPPTTRPGDGDVLPSTAPVLAPNNTPFNHGMERAAAKAGYNTGVGGK